MKEHEKKAYLIAQGCNAVDKYGVPEPETLAAMQEYSDQQNAELREQLDSETESRKYWQRQSQRYQKYHRELNAALERVKELQSQLAKYREALESIANEDDEPLGDVGIVEAKWIAKEALKQQ